MCKKCACLVTVAVETLTGSPMNDVDEDECDDLRMPMFGIIRTSSSTVSQPH